MLKLNETKYRWNIMIVFVRIVESAYILYNWRNAKKKQMLLEMWIFLRVDLMGRSDLSALFVAIKYRSNLFGAKHNTKPTQRDIENKTLGASNTNTPKKSKSAFSAALRVLFSTAIKTPNGSFKKICMQLIK